MQYVFMSVPQQKKGKNKDENKNQKNDDTTIM